MQFAGKMVVSVLTNIRAEMFVFQSFCLFVIISFRYLLTAGLAWWLIRGRSSEFNRDDIHDLRLSVISACIFALALAIAAQLHSIGLTRIYDRVSTYGWWYIGASYMIVLVLQDGYFYATHRLFHHARFYRLTHQGHHRSRRPSPWTSFAFDPIESLAHAGFLVAIACVVPLHLGTILAVLTTMTIWAVVNHVGLEHLPLRFPHHWLGRWMIGPAHHCIHHSHQDKHYGLYFTFWDRVMGTESRGYNDRLRKIEASILSCYTVDNQ